MVLAYARVSTDKQDNINQEKEIRDYCKQHKINLDEYISVEMSSRKSLEKRRITELYNKLNAGDVLITAELSRLGRDMLEVITLVLDLIRKDVKVIFLRQPELSSMNESTTKLLLSFYAYMAEHERDLISQRTKAGLKKARASGKKLGRPFGSISSSFDKDIDLIKKMRKKGFSRRKIWMSLNDNSKTYQSFLKFCKSRNIK